MVTSWLIFVTINFCILISFKVFSRSPLTVWNLFDCSKLFLKFWVSIYLSKKKIMAYVWHWIHILVYIYIYIIYAHFYLFIYLFVSLNFVNCIVMKYTYWINWFCNDQHPFQNPVIPFSLLGYSNNLITENYFTENVSSWFLF